MRKIVTTLTAAALLAAAPAAAASANALAPAAETKMGSGGESAQFENMGTAGYVIAALLAGLIIWGVVELVDDNKSVSPE